MIRRIFVAAVALLAMTSAAARAVPGDLDPSFADGGRFTNDFEDTSASATAVAVQPDGKILLAGSAYGDFTVLRLQPDGSLDRHFGHHGVAIIDFGHPRISCQLDYPCGARGFSDASGVAVQPDGRIVVGGTAYVKTTDFDFAAARLTPRGKLDKTFSGNGKATVDAGEEYDQAADMALQPDGRIVLAGRQGDENTTSNAMALARLTLGGRADRSFGHDGVVVSAFVSTAQDDRANALALQPDGKIVAAGQAYLPDGYEPIVARFTADGSPDPTFGGEGHTIVKFPGEDDAFYAVGLQSTGAIVLSGIAYVDGPKSLAVARVTPDGGLDASFGQQGRELLGYADRDELAYSEASDLAVAGDDRIVLGTFSNHGDVDQDVGFDQDVGVFRLIPDGSLDRDFGNSGRQEAGLRPDVGQSVGLALQPDGATVLATGTCAQKQQFCNRYQFAAARFAGS
jgi:uncharacterized delta-60 repeat protein